MKNILCPIDFSETSIHALEFASAIAGHENGSLMLLNIFTPSEFNKILKSEHLQEEYDALLDMAELKLKTLAEEIMSLAKNEGLQRCDYRLKSGEIVDIVAEVAEAEKSDLIVVGTTGHSAYEKRYVGGNTERIIRHVNCPVLCIPENHTFHGINRIVYATDYQEEDKLAIQQVIALAIVMEAELKIVHVSHHNHSIDKAMYEAFVGELSHFIHYERTTFDRVVFDHVPQGLDQYVKEIEADLLILLNKRLTLVENLFHRSLMNHLDKFADYPLLVLKL